MFFFLMFILLFTNIIFFFSLFGLMFLIKSNFFLIISIESMLLAINLNFLFFSIYLESVIGTIFNFYIIIISAAEMVILLSYFISYFTRVNGSEINENYSYIKY